MSQAQGDEQRLKHFSDVSKLMPEEFRKAYVGIELNCSKICLQNNFVECLGFYEHNGTTIPAIYVEHWPLTKSEMASLPTQINGLRTAILYRDLEDDEHGETKEVIKGIHVNEE